jgi:hypothetical protein
VRGLPRPEKQPAYLAALAIYPGDCYATTNFLDADFGESGVAILRVGHIKAKWMFTGYPKER